MPKLYITVGLPGTGKSTWSKEMASDGVIWLSSDAVRAELFGSESTQGNPKEIFRIIYDRARKYITAGKDVIIDSTGVERWARKESIESVDGVSDVKRVCVFFMAEESVVRERSHERTDHEVPDYVIDRMIARFDCPIVEERFDEFIFIVDGKKINFATNNLFDGMTYTDVLNTIKGA